MSNQWLFFGQISTIVTLILALFGVYRVLVRTKDATIELLKEQLREKSELLALTQYPNFRETIEGLKADAKSRQGTLQAQIRELEASGGAKDTQLAELRQQLAETSQRLRALQGPPQMLSTHAAPAEVQAYVRTLGWVDLNEYFERVLSRGREQAQKQYGREPLPSAEHEEAIRDTAAAYARDWADRKGVRSYWDDWSRITRPAAPGTPRPSDARRA